VPFELPIVERPHTGSATSVALGAAAMPTGCGSKGGCGGGGTTVAASEARRLPRWLKRNVPKGDFGHKTSRTLDGLGLVTVCEEARCPNRMECWSQLTATFMILGDTCTRPCGFCSVKRGRPELPAADEPQRLAQAAERLGLKHVVITSVTRDDLPDGGAQHFVDSIRAIRAIGARRVSEGNGARSVSERRRVTVEVLTPDFVQQKWALDLVANERPEVFNHNTETVPRLYRRVRGPKSDYQWTLGLLARVRELQPDVKTKSGLMLGLGETQEETLDVLADLRSVGCDYLTIGQYLKPGDRYLDVVRYAAPEEFDQLGELAKSMGFKKVASGPFVRSSYHARDMAEDT